MNRSLCSVTIGVATLAVLGMTARLARAQTDAAFAIPTAELLKEKPRLYRYESYWAFPPAHWGDVDRTPRAGTNTTRPTTLPSTRTRCSRRRRPQYSSTKRRAMIGYGST